MDVIGSMKWRNDAQHLAHQFGMETAGALMKNLIKGRMMIPSQKVKPGKKDVVQHNNKLIMEGEILAWLFESQVAGLCLGICDVVVGPDRPLNEESLKILAGLENDVMNVIKMKFEQIRGEDQLKKGNENEQRRIEN